MLSEEKQFQRSAQTLISPQPLVVGRPLRIAISSMFRNTGLEITIELPTDNSSQLDAFDTCGRIDSSMACAL